MTSIVPQSDIPQPGDSRSDLYDRDFVLWCDEMVAHLKTRDWDKLDVENLIEEIEGLTRRDKRELGNRLTVLLAHLLKRLHVKRPDDYRGWEGTIREQRRQLRELLEESPSLKSYWLQRFSAAWRYALEDVKADYPKVDFPEEWQYSRDIEELLSTPFWLESSKEAGQSDDR